MIRECSHHSVTFCSLETECHLHKRHHAWTWSGWHGVFVLSRCTGVVWVVNHIKDYFYYTWWCSCHVLWKIIAASHSSLPAASVGPGATFDSTVETQRKHDNDVDYMWTVTIRDLCFHLSHKGWKLLGSTYSTSKFPMPKSEKFLVICMGVCGISCAGALAAYICHRKNKSARFLIILQKKKTWTDDVSIQNLGGIHYRT